MMKNFNIYSTGIKGLDKLFKEGLYINDNNENGLIILIKGDRGTRKNMLAMQMMYGLTKSFVSKDNNSKHNKTLNTSDYYSLTKSTEELENMYLDILAGDNISYCINEYNRARFHNAGTEEVTNLLREFLTNEFDLGISTSQELAKSLLSLESVYNTRVHQIQNIRKRDNGEGISWKKKNTHNVILQNDNRQITIDFKKQGYCGDSISKQSNPLATFMGFYGEVLEEACNITDNTNRKPVVVFDGFSHIPTEELCTLPYHSLFDALRKIARVSILVMDNRDIVNYDADIVLYTRNQFDEKEQYTFNEIQIGKCVFQETALGWHQYKRRDYGIEVYPSLHRLLSKPFHYHNRGVTIGNSVFETSVDDYKYQLWHGGLYNQLTEEEKKDYNKLKAGDNYNIKSPTPPQVYSVYKKANPQDNPLKHILLDGECSTTAIIGNPNSFKRFLTCSISYALAKKQEIHTLYFFFDKNTLTMRGRLICPSTECPQNDKCTSCISRIHSIELLHGCISADEFFYMLQDKIDLFTKNQDGKQVNGLHIVIDDLQIIEYCFPMLNNNNLFLSTLISICRNNHVKLTILCDKHTKMTKALCALSDYVLAIRREHDWENQIEIIIERGGGNVFPVYCIENPQSMFNCDNRELIFSYDIKDPIKLGAMTHYWRDTFATIAKNETENRNE